MSIALGVSESDLIYHSLFIIAQVFQVVLCADALYQRNTGNALCLIHHHLACIYVLSNQT